MSLSHGRTGRAGRCRRAPPSPLATASSLPHRPPCCSGGRGRGRDVRERGHPGRDLDRSGGVGRLSRPLPRDRATPVVARCPPSDARGRTGAPPGPSFIPDAERGGRRPSVEGPSRSQPRSGAWGGPTPGEPKACGRWAFPRERPIRQSFAIGWTRPSRKAPRGERLPPGRQPRTEANNNLARWAPRQAWRASTAL